MNLKTEYGKWIGKMEWNYFITVRKNYKVSKKGIRRLIEKLGNQIQSSSTIEKMFIVGERDFDDWDNFHTHILINTTGDQHEIESFLRKSLGEKDNIHTEPVIDNQSVGIYLTKFINKDIDYDLFINENMMNNKLNNERQEVIDYCINHPEEFVKGFLKRYRRIDSQRNYLKSLPTKQQRLSHIKQLLNHDCHE